MPQQQLKKNNTHLPHIVSHVHASIHLHNFPEGIKKGSCGTVVYVTKYIVILKKKRDSVFLFGVVCLCDVQFKGVDFSETVVLDTSLPSVYSVCTVFEKETCSTIS